jgi:hypothetical protein
VLVAPTCDPSYTGGRDQKDQGLKPASANSLQDPISKTPVIKNGWWSGSDIGPEFKPQYHKQKQNKNPVYHLISLDNCLEKWLMQ